MVVARLFLMLALLQLGWAFFEPQPIDIHLHATYFVIGKGHLQILFAVTSVVFALLYVTAVRWSYHLNAVLGLVHFFLATAAFRLLVSAFLLSSSSQYASAAAYAIPLGVLFFLLGCVILAINCGWACLRILQSRS